MNDVNLILEMVKLVHPEATYVVQSNFWEDGNEIIFSVGNHHSVIFENELKIAPNGNEELFFERVIASIYQQVLGSFSKLEKSCGQ
jgi:hypothetical protein